LIIVGMAKAVRFRIIYTNVVMKNVIRTNVIGRNAIWTNGATTNRPQPVFFFTNYIGTNVILNTDTRTKSIV
jgi:hypothetical protein